MKEFENQLSKEKLVLWSFLLFIFFLPSHAQLNLSIESQKSDSMSNQIIGSYFPDFTLTNTNGDTITNQLLKGKITIINFWFEDCAPCIFELNDLNQLISKFKSNPDFQFLSFTTDSYEKAKLSIEKLGLTYDVFPITPKDSKRLFCTAFPTNIIIDQEGKVAYRKTGVSRNNIHIRQLELLTAFLLTENNLKSPYSYSVSASVLQDSLNNNRIDLTKIFKQLEEKRTAAIGSKYFNFNAMTLNGKRISHDDLLRKITVIYFWEESCAPCVKLFDFYNNLYSHYKNNPVFQFFSFTPDTKEKAEKIVDKYNLLFDVACFDKNEIYDMNYQMGFPLILIINPKGNVSFLKLGGFSEEGGNVMKIEIDNLLGEFFSDN